MAVARVRRTRSALADLVAVGRYIEQDNPVAAQSVVSRVELAGNRLDEFQERWDLDTFLWDLTHLYWILTNYSWQARPD
jgi:hypothetical protein